MQRSNRALLVERETSAQLAATHKLLFRKLQHRVSNNLQVVAARLTVQRRQIADPEAKAALDEASRRLSIIGRISRQLYDPDGAGQQLGPFLEQLALDVIETSGRQDVQCRVADRSDRQISPEAAIPVALIVADPVVNAIEHGFDEWKVTIRSTSGSKASRTTASLSKSRTMAAAWPRASAWRETIAWA
jgi:two-component sensor histidine kinase